MSGRGSPRRLRDAHTHASAGAADLVDLDLRGASGAEILARVRDAGRRRASGAWIRGWGWRADAVDAIALSGLDAAAAEHPVYLARGDGHAAWINAAARAALAVEAAGPVVDEAAFEAARRRLPAPSIAERAESLGAQLARFAANGIRAIDDFVEPWGPDAYARLEAAGRLPVQAGLWLSEGTAPGDAAALRAEFPPGRAPVAIRGIKLFLDGTLGARTAALFRPYADDPSNSGSLRIPEREIDDRVRRWAGRGWPVAIHAIGDRAVALALDALGRAPRPEWDAHRIEHAQVVRRIDLPRFAAARVVASVQPGHWRDDRAFAGARLGDRGDVVAYPIGSLVRAGATVVFGSDWPVSAAEPEAFVESAAAAERGEEALTIEAAYRAASA